MIKKMLAIIFIVAVAILVCYLIIINMKYKTNVGSIGIQKLSVTENNIKLEGMLAASGKRFRGFDYLIDRDRVIIYVYTSYVSGIFPGGGDINISINDDFRYIKSIYIADDSSQKSIWTKGD